MDLSDLATLVARQGLFGFVDLFGGGIVSQVRIVDGALTLKLLDGFEHPLASHAIDTSAYVWTSTFRCLIEPE